MKGQRGKKFCFEYAEFQRPEIYVSRDIQQAEERARLDIWNWKLSVSRERVINLIKYIFHERGNHVWNSICA